MNSTGRVIVVWMLLALISFGAVVQTVSPSTARAAPEILTGIPVRLVLPSLVVDAEVAAFGLNTDQTMPVPERASLVAWYSFSAQAGAFGNVVLAGHRDWQRQRGVFYALAKLADGDEVWLQDGAGNWYLYKVVWSVSMEDDAAPVDEIVGSTERPSVTLITCSGVFDREAGRYVERQIVRAELVAVVRASDENAEDG